MNDEIARPKKRFPWIALLVFIVALVTSIVVTFNAADLSSDPELTELAELNPEMMSLGLVFGAVFGVIGGLIGIGIQYLVTKFPTQWIAKDTDVYKNEIWSALFYSSAIGVVFELIIILLDIGMGNILSIISNVIITGAFLYLYLSGESKPQHIKKAITIVSAAILLIRIVGIIA
ncbi:MAG: hypothetical protein L0J40_03965 [Alkalibacterium sp.]|nr:hypothetical protein [Alkalibacterium sp.]MDN6398678.1 hypothetical protein [Alkalibacterium sp.]